MTEIQEESYRALWLGEKVVSSVQGNGSVIVVGDRGTIAAVEILSATEVKYHLIVYGVR